MYLKRNRWRSSPRGGGGMPSPCSASPARSLLPRALPLSALLLFVTVLARADPASSPRSSPRPPRAGQEVYRQDCARCHQCAPGTLLGAFAYHLTPAPRAPGRAAIPSAVQSNLVARLTAPPAAPRSRL